MPRGLKKAEKSKSKKCRLSFPASALSGSSQMVASYTLQTQSDCESFTVILHLWSCPCPDIGPSGKECFGAHLGAPQTANLGDGNGWVNQTLELRNDFGNPDVGACWESLVGGNHLRLWRQNGPKARTNALFLAYVNQQRGVFLLFGADCVCRVSGVGSVWIIVSPRKR